MNAVNVGADDCQQPGAARCRAADRDENLLVRSVGADERTVAFELQHNAGSPAGQFATEGMSTNDEAG